MQHLDNTVWQLEQMELLTNRMHAHTGPKLTFGLCLVLIGLLRLISHLIYNILLYINLIKLLSNYS